MKRIVATTGFGRFVLDRAGHGEGDVDSLLTGAAAHGFVKANAITARANEDEPERLGEDVRLNLSSISTIAVEEVTE